ADQGEMNAIVMQRMSKVLPFFMFFIMVTVPGALALYYAVSNLVAVGQQAYLLRKDEEELEDIAEEVIEKPIKKKKVSAVSTPPKPKPPTSGTNITKIVAKDTGRK
ncbi:hypothetical protein KBD20_04225, partial [Candidatus Saccharibacteria bacterium]|nr:hypothetical protein [Candidatus Saccharibacteria bacterium]